MIITDAEKACDKNQIPVHYRSTLSEPEIQRNSFNFIKISTKKTITNITFEGKKLKALPKCRQKARLLHRLLL